MTMANDVDSILYPAFREASGWAAHFELILRMHAFKVEELREHWQAQKLYNLETSYISHFEKIGYLIEDDKSTLQECRKWRNDLLHINFDSLNLKVERFTGRSALSPVTYVNNITGDSMPVTETKLN